MNVFQNLQTTTIDCRIEFQIICMTTRFEDIVKNIAINPFCHSSDSTDAITTNKFTAKEGSLVMQHNKFIFTVKNRIKT